MTDSQDVDAVPGERDSPGLTSDVRMLLAVRVTIVTSLLLAAVIIQYTVEIVLPIDYFYAITGGIYALTLLYIGLARVLRHRTTNLYVQLFGDLAVETVLIYFTGGLDSPFSFLYLVSIIVAAMLLYRRGGFIVASGAVIFYGGLADLLYFQVIPEPPYYVFSETWTSMRLYLNMIANFAGFYATALLTSVISEKLRETAEELEQNQRNLAELQALNQKVIESIPSGIIALSSAGTISFVNPAALDILRASKDHLLGRSLVEAGVFNRGEWNSLVAASEAEKVVRGEKSDYRSGGQQTSIGYALTHIDSMESEDRRHTLIFQDLTEVKRLEAQLRLKDRMAAVGELSAGIAHEIRNPLAAIAGSVQVLKKSESLSTQEQRLMSIILKESDRLNQTIADFLRFVKPQVQHPVQFDVAATLAEILDLLSHSPEVSETHIVKQTIDPPSFTIVGDPNQIRQVFWNVTKNAIQAMPEGGVLRVRAGLSENFYRISFSDTGLGMTPEEQQVLFQPFRTGFPSGTGLGLAISYRIVQEHKGTILVESRPGRGTTMDVFFPASVAPARVEENVNSHAASPVHS